MRRAATMAVAVVVWLAATACQPAEPAMTISASTNRTPVCQSIQGITGTVRPADATTKVVLQRTVNGKWTDWKSINKPGQTPHVLTANVASGGTYHLRYMVPRTTGTIHFRIRSNGSTAFSPSLYVTPWTGDPWSDDLGVCA